MRRFTVCGAAWAVSGKARMSLTLMIVISMTLGALMPIAGQRTGDSAWKVSGAEPITMAEQGIVVDPAKGYDIPREWRKPETRLRLVQFVGPAEGTWEARAGAVSGEIVRSIGDNAIVVRSGPENDRRLAALDFVRWSGPYEPRFKVQSKLLGMAGDIDLVVTGCPGLPEGGLAGELAALGATRVEDTHFGAVNCRISAQRLPMVAALDSVILVEHLPDMVPLCSASGRVVQAHDLWVNTVSNLPQNIMGQGQIVHIQDTGIDASYRDFLYGPLGDRLENPDSTTDSDSHGTFMAGIVGGNGYNMETYLGLPTTNRIYNELAASNPAGYPDRMGFAGRAPECTIYMRAGLVSTEWSAGYTFGARIFSNSWGPATTNNNYDSTADTFMNSNPGALVLFASGRDGPKANTVSGYGNGKLALSVGGFENIRPLWGEGSDGPAQVLSNGGRGPVADGRVKPDVIEVGGNVYGPKSDDVPDSNLAPLYNIISIINADADSSGDYTMLSGNSVATAAASGDCALIRDYLVDVKGIASPHANLIKTLLIHGCEDMGYGYPSFDQGWGRVNVRNSVCPPAPNVLQWHHSDAGIGSGAWSASADGGLQTWISDSSVPLKVTLAHWDAVGSGELTYDLDLVLTSPSGVRYEGNAFSEGWSSPCTGASQWGVAFTRFPSWMGGAPYDWDVADDGGDDENNVELFRVQYPEKGKWDIQVVWRSSTARPFTLAMTGGFNASADANAPGNQYKVGMQLDRPRVVPERDDFGEAVFKAAPGGSVAVPLWVSNGGTSDDNYTMTATSLPSGFTASFQTGSPVNLEAGTRLHGWATVNVASSVVAGTYTLALRALSVNDLNAPIAQSTVRFQVDVQAIESPPVAKLAGHVMHEDAPAMVSWDSGSADYVGCAYRQEERNGMRTYFKLSSDGGATWGAPVAVGSPSWSPGFVGIARATSGSYQGRLLIAYNAWNPDGYLGNHADTRCAYVKVAYADAPYTTWTEANAFTLGEGRSTGNTYRAVNVVWHAPTNAFMLVVESFGYDGLDIGTSTLNDISCCYKTSTTGGATWGALGYVDPNGSGVYYFFPSAVVDMSGNIFVFFYERDSSDASQDRDMSFRYYNGAWGAYSVCWDTTDNIMFPAGAAAPQGVNGNRVYSAVIKGPNTDGDRSLYLIWTDNAGASWQTNNGNGYGPCGPVISDQGYAYGFILDGDCTGDGYVWWAAMRHFRFDPYSQPNIFTVRDYDYAAVPDPVLDYVTLDSYPKGKQRVAGVAEGTGLLLAAWNQMTPAAGTDILASRMSSGWQSAPDTWGPVAEDATADRLFCHAGDTVTVAANLDDWQAGGSEIAHARYKTDMNNLTWMEMQPADGAFDAPAEAAVSSAAPISTVGWPAGWHWIFVAGEDALGNVGDALGFRIYVEPTPLPYAHATGPVGRSGNMFPTITYGFGNGVTEVSIHYTDDGGASWHLLGNDDTLDGQWTTGTMLPPGTYHWNARANGESDSNIEAGPYTVDITPPGPPTGLTVERYGIASVQATHAYTFSGVTAAGGPHDAYFLDADDQTQAELTSPNSRTELTDPQYSNIAASDQQRAGPSADPGTSDETHIEYRYLIAEDPSTITSINVTHEGQWGAAQTVTMYALHDDASWDAIGATQAFAAGTEGTMTRTITSAPEYLDGAGRLRVIFASTARANASIDHATAVVSHITTATTTEDNTLNWTASASPDVDHYNIYRSDAEFGTYALIGTVPAGMTSYEDDGMGTADFTFWWYMVRAVDEAGNEEQNGDAVPEPNPYGPPYGIDLAGIAPGSWAFVSFPVQVSGDIETILNDTAWGDGQSDWDVAKTWNNVNKAWHTHRRGGTANTFSDVNNRIGIWLHLISNGGDQALSVPPGAEPSVQDIGLFAGWNMVGFPSGAQLAASETLPPEIDMVSVWQAAYPYIADHSNLAAVTMSDGHGYWLRATADCIWNVAWHPPAPLVNIQKGAPVTVNPGGTMAYTISYENLGAGSAYNVWVNDTLPPSVAFVSATPPPTVLPCSWSLGTLGPGSAGLIEITVAVAPSAAGVLTNTATAEYADAAGMPRAPASDTADTAVINPVVNLLKSAQALVSPGELMTYSLNYSNAGNDIAYDCIVNESYPAGVTFVSSVPAPTMGDDTWILPNLAPGASGSILITVVVNAAASGTLLNSAGLRYENGAGLEYWAWSSASTVVQPLVGPVQNLDTGEYFDTIQAAIDDPETVAGHTVSVSSGMYREHVLVNKAIRLVGEGRDTTVIDAENSTDAVRITASGVELTGFTLHDAGDEEIGKDAAVELYNVKNCHIHGNIMEGALIGIWLKSVSMTDDDHIIEANEVRDNAYGIYVEVSRGNSLLGNNIHNQSRGIYISATGTLVGNNTIAGSDYGILMSGGNLGTLYGNLFEHNWIAVYIYSGTSNKLYHNDFRNSVQHVYTETANTWDDGYPSGGNLWDTYLGTDLFSGPGQDLPGPDGICDDPLPLGNGNEDRYPLMPYWPLTGQVQNLDTGEYFITIQAAIDDPDTLGGHRISVSEGTYAENIAVTKRVSIDGAGAGLTVIDGGSAPAPGIRLAAQGARLSNVTVLNCTPGQPGISMEADHVTVCDNTVMQNPVGMRLGTQESLSTALDATADFDSGNKSSSSDCYEVETSTDNPAVPDGMLSLGSMFGDRFTHQSYDFQTWKWLPADDKWFNNGVRSGQSRNIGITYGGKGFMSLMGVVQQDDIGMMSPWMIDSSENWEVQIDFERLYAENNNQWLFGLNLFRDWNGTGMPPSDMMRMVYYGFDTGMRYYADMTAGGTGQGSQYVSTPHTSGKLRMAYDAGTNAITFHYWGGSSWTQLWSKTYDIDSWKLKLVVPLLSYSTGLPDIQICFDNFQAAGKLSAPTGRASGTWTSDMIQFNSSHALTEVVIDHAGAGPGRFIDAIEWLVNGSVVASFDEDIDSGTTATIRWTDLPGDSFYAIQDDFRIRLRLAGDGNGSVLVDRIVHRFAPLTGFDNGLITRNNVSGNGVGIEVVNAGQCSVFGNDFAGNGIQAADMFGACSWDAGYPEGGNAWSDYAGSDFYSGPGQDVPGPDGIGDEPHLFQGGQDNYPLMTGPSSAPSVSVVKVVDRVSAMPREYLNYTVHFNNTGDGAAELLTLNDTLPAGVTFVAASVTPDHVLGRNLIWEFADIGPGAHSLTITVKVDVGVPKGTVLANRAACDYIPVGNHTEAWANTTVNWLLPPYSVYGYVRDNYGLPVAGATVTVTDEGTGESLAAGTNALGQYSVDLSALPSGYMDGDTLSLATSNPSGGLNSTYVDTALSGEQVDLTVDVQDATAPAHSNEQPQSGGLAPNSTPVMSVDVTDLQSGVNASTVRLYVQGFSVMYDLAAIADGYSVSYWHEAGFSAGTTVACRIVARDHAGNLLDWSWSFTVP